MTAAILHGVPATTIDVDLWIDLPERQYMRVLNLCRGLGAKIIANTIVALENDSLINFLYRVDGLASFATEMRKAARMKLLGHMVSVLPLESVIRSKEFVGRPKDLAHLPLLRDVQTCSTKLMRPKRPSPSKDARRKTAA